MIMNEALDLVCQEGLLGKIPAYVLHTTSSPLLNILKELLSEASGIRLILKLQRPIEN